jgi:hypothetical protein
MKELLPSRSCTTSALIAFGRLSELYHVCFNVSGEAIANAWLEGSPHCQSLPQTGVNARVASGLKQDTYYMRSGRFLRYHVRCWAEHVTPTSYDLTIPTPSVTARQTGNESTLFVTLIVLVT